MGVPLGGGKSLVALLVRVRGDLVDFEMGEGLMLAGLGGRGGGDSE